VRSPQLQRLAPTPHSALRTSHSALRTPHFALRTPHSALRTPHSALPQCTGRVVDGWLLCGPDCPRHPLGHLGEGWEKAKSYAQVFEKGGV